MKKILTITISLFLAIPLFTLPVFAEDEKLENPLKFGTVWGVIGAFLPVVAMIIGVALVGYLLYGAYMWMSAADKPDRLEGAQKTLTNAVIGFALFGVMLGLFFFLSFVLDIDWADLISRGSTP